jgi:hypothetical protein
VTGSGRSHVTRPGDGPHGGANGEESENTRRGKKRRRRGRGGNTPRRASSSVLSSSSAAGRSPSGGGAQRGPAAGLGEATDDEDKRRRKRKPTEEALRGGAPSASFGQHHASTVYVDSQVRWLREDGHCSVKTLKELLVLGTAHIASEADTPVVGPAPTPAARSGEGPLLPNTAAGSPMLSFTLDGIATPNTFAAMGPQPGMRGAPSALSLSPLPPALLVENFYVHLQRNFRPTGPPSGSSETISGDGSFDYYDCPDTLEFFFTKFMDLSEKAAQCLQQEPMMACVSAPVYVFGDIHGNFADLSYFLKNIICFNDIHLSPCNILCLGDYVDRGPFSLECVMLLFALKLEAPHKITLLRGNHEDRVVCGDRKTYGNDCFLAQCLRIFGIDRGNTLFKAVTSAFRYLPLACEIIVPCAPNTSVVSQKSPIGMVTAGSEDGGGTSDVLTSLPTMWHPHAIGNHSWRRQTDQRRQTHTERILCSHGGIPRFSGPPKDNDMLAFLRGPKFPKLLTLFPNNPAVKHDPEVAAATAGLSEEDALRAWFVVFDLMWSDPTTDDTPASAVNEWGFATNSRGSNVVTFSQKAVETFLSAYKYSMLIRAHQEKAHGIRLSKSHKVLTVFSSSNYLGHGNGAGCVVVTQFGDVHLLVKSSS